MISAGLISQQRGDGQAIDDLFSKNHFNTFFQRNPKTFADFARMEVMVLNFFKIITGKQKRGIIKRVQPGMKIKKRFYLTTVQPRFLQTFTPGALFRSFSGINPSTRYFPGELVDEKTILPDEQNLLGEGGG